MLCRPLATPLSATLANPLTGSSTALSGPFFLMIDGVFLSVDLDEPEFLTI
jgi:hypothetical protein